MDQGRDQRQLAVTSAIPALFAAYATLTIATSKVQVAEQNTRLMQILERASPQDSWWLGFLDTGAQPPMFDQAPMVHLYNGNCCLVQGGGEQALGWRADVPGKGGLPDLLFPQDRSWLVSTLGDDDWRYVGGSAELIGAIISDTTLQARTVSADEDSVPPGHTAI